MYIYMFFCVTRERERDRTSMQEREQERERERESKRARESEWHRQLPYGRVCGFVVSVFRHQHNRAGPASGPGPRRYFLPVV